MLKNLRANWSEADLVELIIYGVSELDVRNAATNRNCQTISELLVFLSSFSKPSTSSDNAHINKSITGERNFPKKKFSTTDYHSSTSRKMNKHCYQWAC